MVEPPYFHDLDLSFFTDIGIFLVTSSFDLCASTNIQTHWSVEFQGTTTRSCFWIPKHNPNFFTQLVDKDGNSFVLLIEAPSLRMAWLIIRACKPTWLSPISPSISPHEGTRAATESTTTRSTAPESINFPAISRPCSPESGCDKSNSSILTPRAAA